MEKKDFIRLKNVSIQKKNRDSLTDISMNLLLGEMHMLMSDNVPETELMIDLLTGKELCTGGGIYLEEKELSPHEAAEFFKENVACAQYHDEIVEDISIAENIFLLNDKGYSGQVIRHKEFRIKTMVLFRDLGIDELDVRQNPGELTEYQKRLAFIARAMAVRPKLLILDNIAINLHVLEVEKIIEIIKKIKDSGVNVLCISSQVGEIVSIADRLSVLRNGMIVATTTLNDKPLEYVENLLLSRIKEREKSEKQGWQELLRVENLVILGREALSFSIGKGEVLWMIGQREAQLAAIGKALFGIAPALGGKILLEGAEIKITSIKDAIRHRIGYIPENDLQNAILPGETVAKNITLGVLDLVSSAGVIDDNREKHIIQEWKAKFQIEAADDMLAEEIDNTGQKKLVLARCLAVRPKVLIIDSLASGMGYTLRQLMMKCVRELANEGMATVVLANELSDISEYADRILVLTKTNICAEIGGDNNEMMLLNSLRGKTEM